MSYDTHKSGYEDNQIIIFCVHLTESLMRESGGRCAFKEILESLHELMASLVITLPDTGVGCYLFNCADSNEGSTQKEGVYELIGPAGLSVDAMKCVHDMLEDGTYRDHKVLDPTGKNTSEQLINVLNTVSWDSGKRYMHKKVFLFTDFDKPFAKNLQRKLALKETTKNFNRSYKFSERYYSVSLYPFFIDSGKRFDTTEYSELLPLYRRVPDEQEQDSDAEDEDNDYEDHNRDLESVDVSDIKAKVAQLKKMKRFYFRCPLTILRMGEREVSFSVRGYSMYVTDHPKHTNEYVIENDKLEQVVSSAQMYTETGAEVNPNSDEVENSVVHTYKFGSQYIPFTGNNESGQLARLRRAVQGTTPRLELWGYRDLSRFMPHFCLGAPILLMPDTSGLLHSTRTYTALAHTMIKKNKFAILWGRTRATSVPSLHALVSNDGSLLLYRLPFKDDIRALPKMSVSGISGDYTELQKDMKNVVSKLDGQFDPSAYPDPNLNWHYKILKDQVFQMDVREEYYTGGVPLERAQLLEINELDETKSAACRVRERISEGMDVKTELPEDHLAWSFTALNVETADAPAYEKSVKRAKPEVVEVPERDVHEAWRAGRLQLYKNDQLSLFCKAKGLQPTGRKKQDLIDSISDYLSIHENGLNK